MFLTSLTRNTDFAERPFEVVILPREQWATGDFVVAELAETSELAETFAIETVDGRRVEVIPGDLIVGALGCRDAKLGMGDFVSRVSHAALDAPVVLIIGTSMECGKTIAAKSVVRRLKAHGLRVAGAKLSGAGHLRDILSMRDAGADAIFDFVDVGLSSTMVSAATYEAALLQLLSQLGGAHPDSALDGLLERCLRLDPLPSSGAAPSP